VNYADVFGLTPARVIRPQTLADAAEAVRSAQSVLPWGGGTGQDYGTPPRKGETLLDLSGLNRVVAHEYADMTITVEAGVTLAALQAQLAQHGQFLPLDPPNAETATVGGLLATDAFGPYRLGYGTARDWLIGLKVLDAQGRLIKGGGKVVKNVTGYDLPKLHIGALGTLGVIVEATFKVSPKPAAVCTLVAQATSASRLEEAAVALWNETRPVSLLLHEDRNGRYLVALYHGTEPVVTEAAEKGAERIRGLAFGTPTLIPEELVPESEGAAVQVRLFGKAAAASDLHRQVMSVVAETGATIDTFLGIGCTTVTWPEATASAQEGAHKLLRFAKQRPCRFTLVHGPLALRGGDLEALWFPLPTSRVLQERLKEALDPTSVLNPGRFVCGI